VSRSLPGSSNFNYYTFTQIDQRVCEWHGRFASAALSIINAYFDDNDYNTDDSRQDFAASSLESWEFLYRDVSTTMDGEVTVSFLK